MTTAQTVTALIHAFACEPRLLLPIFEYERGGSAAPIARYRRQHLIETWHFPRHNRNARLINNDLPHCNIDARQHRVTVKVADEARVRAKVADEARVRSK
jgi:hypothetical protein